MKEWQSSTMPRYMIKPETITRDQYLVFNQLVAMLKPYVRQLDKRVNTLQHYELWTRHSFRSHTFHPKTKKGILFAGVIILKQYVGFYFYPLHISNTFHAKIDQSILPNWKRGSAFHIDEPLSGPMMDKFEELILSGWEFYVENQWVENN